jgi:hypothetical protein
VTLVIEDTARNTLVAWTIRAAERGTATGAVISPFTTPVADGPKPSAHEAVQRLQNEAVEVWLDPETHALQMPSVGDFRYYDDWPLWGGHRGALSTAAEMRDHVERVFTQQDQLGVPHLAPTILGHSPQSQESQAALELAQIANDLDPEARLAIVGDSAFWASGVNLDAHIGALAQLEPPSWSLTVVRSLTVLPVPAMVEEVHGLCRTARALSEDADVHISHGDLAGLPAVAAGATTLGTGWDPRQKVAAYSSYEVRPTGGGGGGAWFEQATYEGLLSLLTRNEATLLDQQDNALSTRLLPGALLPGPREKFLHHTDVLARIVGDLTAADYPAAYANLLTRYTSAAADWPRVAGVLGIASRGTHWLSGPTDGLFHYGLTEGF